MKAVSWTTLVLTARPITTVFSVLIYDSFSDMKYVYDDINGETIMALIV
jgi:hypothetical protein